MARIINEAVDLLDVSVVELTYPLPGRDPGLSATIAVETSRVWLQDETL